MHVFIVHGWNSNSRPCNVQEQLVGGQVIKLQKFEPTAPKARGGSEDVSSGAPG